jgi:ParB family chromosome partitioning protein
MEQETDYSTELHFGDLVVDRELDDPDTAVIVNTPKVPANGWEVYGDNTVADDNPEYPETDPIVIVVYRDTLQDARPDYEGRDLIRITELNEASIQWYAFPESRLQCVGRYPSTETVPIRKIRNAPYHAREFDPDANQDFVGTIAERGYPKPEPLIRPLDDGYEIVDGHKRVAAAEEAGLETIPCVVEDLSDVNAAQEWIDSHLHRYTEREKQTAVVELQERLDIDVTEMNGLSSSDC